MKMPQTAHKAHKHLEKVRDLSICQTNFMQVLMQKIDNRSKPIRKQERIIAHNLKKKRILLDQENFDIISILKQAVRCCSNSSEKKSSAAHNNA